MGRLVEHLEREEDGGSAAGREGLGMGGHQVLQANVGGRGGARSAGGGDRRERDPAPVPDVPEPEGAEPGFPLRGVHDGRDQDAGRASRQLREPEAEQAAQTQRGSVL